MPVVAIIGSRSYPKLYQIERLMRALPGECDILTGGAQGVDAHAMKVAVNLGFDLYVFPARWDLYGRGAGMVRNKRIVQKADVIFAFWDEASPGTKGVIDEAHKSETPCYVITPESTEETLLTGIATWRKESGCA